MHVLVTGSTGFIGVHLVSALVARGWQVRCLVRATSNRTPMAAHQVEYVVGSLQDQSALRQAVQGIDLIFHLAGATKVRHPDEYDRRLPACRPCSRPTCGCFRGPWWSRP